MFKKVLLFMFCGCFIHFQPLGAGVKSQKKALYGFNSKWIHIPDVKAASYRKFIRNVKSLKPQLLRYPGGTITHSWNWREGKMTKKDQITFVNPIKNITATVKKTSVDVVFVLDIIHSSLDDQIKMLKASKLPVKYIELGNEIYAGEYKKQLPTGKDYAQLVNKWTPKLRQNFPKAKLSVTLLGRTPQGTRLKSWNELVHAHVKDVDAYTYHIYVKGTSVAERLKEYESVLLAPQDKEIWVTEYGIKNEDKLNSTAQKKYIKQLDELRRYIELHSQIALCHILITRDEIPVSDNYSAIKAGGQELNPVGKYFRTLKR